MSSFSVCSVFHIDLVDSAPVSFFPEIKEHVFIGWMVLNSSFYVFHIDFRRKLFYFHI